MSPSESWAKEVMPTRMLSPSRAAHSCSLVYLRCSGYITTSAGWTGAKDTCGARSVGPRRSSGTGRLRDQREEPCEQALRSVRRDAFGPQVGDRVLGVGDRQRPAVVVEGLDALGLVAPLGAVAV